MVEPPKLNLTFLFVSSRAEARKALVYGCPQSRRLSARMSVYEQPGALGLLTQAGPHPHIAHLVGEEICTVARRIVEVCQRHGADVSLLPTNTPSSAPAVPPH